MESYVAADNSQSLNLERLVAPAITLALEIERDLEADGVIENGPRHFDARLRIART